MAVWFITGASRGLGRQLASAALADGDQVIATARDPQAVADGLPPGEGELLPLRLDVTDGALASTVVEEGVDRFGRIDIVVSNAGYGLFGAVEEVSDAEVRQLFDTNVFGLLNVTRAVLPVLRAQGAGHLINISSSAGFAVGAGRGLYGASKFAVEALSEALREELAPLGIQTTVVEPGSFRTEFLSADSRRRAGAAIDAYSETVGSLQTAIAANDGKQPGDPERAVAAIRSIAGVADPPLRLQLGSDCVKLVQGKLEAVASELAQWRELALSTDFRPA